MRRRASPVQQWVDSIPSYENNANGSSFDQQTEEGRETTVDPSQLDNSTAANSMLEKKLQQQQQQQQSEMTASTAIKIPNSPAITTTGPASSVPHNRLVRDMSLQSDSSHCSSVESLLEWRKADPEAILLGLGFGCPNSPQKNGNLARIPKRFLQPSRLKGIVINDFLKQQQESSESLDTASLGYRGLTGSPHVAPSEIVQKIMERLREHESQELESHTNTTSSNEFNSTQQDGRLSVLSPDNRQYLERPRSKSPDMRNKRMIIGQKSFAFGYNGDLIEINSFDNENKFEDSSNDEAMVIPDSSDISQLENSNDSIKIEKSVNNSSRRLAKQQSFDDDNSGDSFQARDREEALAPPYRKKSSDRKESLVTIVSSEDEAATMSTKKSTDQDRVDGEIWDPISRRASDSVCNVNSNIDSATLAEKRRLSEGTVQAGIKIFGRDSLITDKRKFSDRKPSLKRQANVNVDVDITNYEMVMDNENLVRFSTSLDETKSDLSTDKILSDDENFNFDTMSDKETVRQRLNSTEGKDRCCKNDQSDETCGHEEASVDCCCHTSSINCRRKLSKIMRRNQKLEDIVAKNRREMAEMREMLNSVMSVRMEPGF